MSFNKEIIEIFDYIGKSLGIVIDWNNKNVIPYIEELCNKLITWEIATSTIWLLIGIVCLSIASFMFKKDIYVNGEMERVTFGLLIVVGLCIFFSQVFYITEYLFSRITNL